MGTIAPIESINVTTVREGLLGPRDKGREKFNTKERP